LINPKVTRHSSLYIKIMSLLAVSRVLILVLHMSREELIAP